ncbi:MAG: hypothetical protein IH623_03465 [Verrucomicrobia bacterium]|nr:hypothetical protein [Verrucomicrobiota bacterium]
MLPAEVLGGRVPAKKLIASSSSFLNLGRQSASTNSAANGGFTGLRLVSPISKTSSRAFHSFQMTGGTNTPCAFLHGKIGLYESIDPLYTLIKVMVAAVSC